MIILDDANEISLKLQGKPQVLRVTDENNSLQHSSEGVISVTTFEGIIENGRVQLPLGICLPERKIVYVIVPENDTSAELAFSGLRLANRADAAKFEMKVTRGEEL